MTNSFYNKTGIPATSAPGLSQDIRAEFAAVEAGFNKLPTLSGNAGKSLIVNAGGNAVVADPVLHLSQSDIARGTDIAVVASGSVTLPAIGSYFVVTGTGFNVTGFANSYNGRTVTLKLPAGLTLVHSASLVLSGAYNRVTHVGDTITLVNTTTGVWEETNYTYKLGQPAFLVHRNGVSSGTITTGVLTTIEFTTKDFDPYSLFNTGTFEATIKTPGLYSLFAKVRLVANSGNISLTSYIFNNGLMIGYGQKVISSGSTTGSVEASVIAKLAVGDVINFKTQFIGGTSGSLNGGIPDTQAFLFKIG
jgi:hypothetical protein